MSDPHVTPARTFFLVWGGLLVLLAATVGGAYISLGSLGWVFHYALAVTMATLIMVFFMHLRDSRTLTRIFAISGFFWLSFLFVLSLADYLSR